MDRPQLNFWGDRPPSSPKSPPMLRATGSDPLIIRYRSMHMSMQFKYSLCCFEIWTADQQSI